MTLHERRQAELELQKAHYSIAAACRVLEVSAVTMRKWIRAGLVHLTEIGPPGHSLKRLTREEVIRLKRAA